MRFAVLESALVNWPLLQVACAVQEVLMDVDEGWYVLAAHAVHALFARWKPALHVPQWCSCVRLASATSAPFLHSPAPLHSRSLVLVGALAWYS